MNNDSKLFEYLKKLDEDAQHEEKLTLLQAEIYDTLLSGSIITIGNDRYSIDDFVSDFDIDVIYFASFISGDSRDLLSQAKAKLNQYAAELAAKSIDKETEDKFHNDYLKHSV